MQVTGCNSRNVDLDEPRLDVEGAAGQLAALGHPVRLRLLSLVASHEGQEACVCDLTDSFDLSQPTISHHLKVMHEVGPRRVAARRAELRVETAVGFVQYGELRLQHGHLQDLGALHFTAGKSVVDRPAQHRFGQARGARLQVDGDDRLVLECGRGA